MKLCKDCKHARGQKYRSWPWQKYRENFHFAQCWALHVPVIDPVTGADTWRPLFCEIERKSSRSCGPDARLFEERG